MSIKIPEKKMEMDEDEEIVKFISIDKVKGKFEIEPNQWNIFVDMEMTFCMSQKTMNYIEKKAIVLHINHLEFESIYLQNLSDGVNTKYQCEFTKTPGILNNLYTSDEKPTYETFETNYSGSIGQLSIKWPQQCEMNVNANYCLYLKYKTNNGNGLYSNGNTMYTLNGYYDTASWMPCVCNSFKMVRYEMTYIVPEPYVVLASGTPSIPIVENQKRTFNYILSTRVLMKSYGFIVSNVKLLPIENSLPVGFFASKMDSPRAEYTFSEYIPKAFKIFKNVTSFDKPYDVSIVAVSELPFSKTITFAGLILVSNELLYLEDNCDLYRKYIYEIGRAIASQWFGHFIVPHETSDEWITIGLRDYLAEQFIKNIVGQNYVKYKSILSQNEVMEKKWGTPLHNENSHIRDIFVEMEINEHFEKKCKIAMGVMENSFGKEKMEKLIKETIFHTNEELTDILRAMKTKVFVKELQKVNSSLMKQFEERLVCGTGYGKISVELNFPARETKTVFTIKQSKKEKGYNVVPVRIRELEQTVEDNIELTGDETIKSIAYHSTGRKGRKKVVKTDVDDTVDVEFESPILYIEIDPDNDYPRKIKREKNSFTEMMLIAQLQLARTVRGQLVAVECLEKSLHKSTPEKSKKSIDCLFDSLLNNHHCFYKVQIAAAKAIARMSCQENGYYGFKLLEEFYKTNYYENMNVVPLDFTNQLQYEIQKGLIQAFADIRIHQLKQKINFGEEKEIKIKKSQLKNDQTTESIIARKKVKANKMKIQNYESYPPTVELLIEIAENSTNERNPYQYGVFLKSIIYALSSIKTSNPEMNERIQKFITRELHKDKIIPSDRNIVTLAVLKSSPHLCDLDSLVKPGNYYEVRVMAIRAMILQNVENPEKGLHIFYDIHRNKEKGKIRHCTCEMLMKLKNFPSDELKMKPFFIELGKNIYTLLVDREDYVQNKIDLALLFKKWWNEDLVPKPVIEVPPPVIDENKSDENDNLLSFNIILN